MKTNTITRRYISYNLASGLVFLYLLVFVVGDSSLLHVAFFGPSTILMLLGGLLCVFLISIRPKLAVDIKYMNVFYIIAGLIILETVYEGVFQCCPEAVIRFLGRSIITPLVLFYVFSQLDIRNKLKILKMLGFSILLIGFIGSVLSVVQYVTANEIFYIFRGSDGALIGHLKARRVYGLASKPYLWAMFLMLSIFILAAYREKINRVVYFLLLSLFVASLFMTQARSVIFSFLLTLCFIPVISMRRISSNDIFIKLAVGLFLIGTMAIPLFFVAIINYYGVENLGGASSILSSSSVSHRLYMADIISSYMFLNPFHFSGYGGLPALIDSSNIRFLSEIPPESEAVIRGLGPHNFFFAILIDVGVVVFVFIFAFIVKVLSYFLKHMNPCNVIYVKKYYGYAFLAIFFSGIGQNNEETTILWSVFFFYLIFRNIENSFSYISSKRIKSDA